MNQDNANGTGTAHGGDGAWLGSATRALTGIEPEPRQVEVLLRFVAELERWNRAYNLTAVRDRGDMMIRHLADSLTVYPFLRGTRILDLGSGAGLPGIPLAIVDPALQLTSLDASGKKIRFQRHVRRILELDNLELVHGRAQDFRPPEPYDSVLARALASLPALASMAAPLTAAGGRLVAMKGRYPQSELAEDCPGFDIDAVERVQVPGSEAERHVVILTRREPRC